MTTDDTLTALIDRPLPLLLTGGRPSHVVVPIETLRDLIAEILKLRRQAVPGVAAPGDSRVWFSDGDDAETMADRIMSHVCGTRAPVSMPLPADENTAASDSAMELAEEVAAYDAGKARNEESFSAAVADRLIAGENPVKVFREYRGLGQKDLAARAGTSAAYLSQIETGRRGGSTKLLRRLANALDVELADLID